jgi:hypothetical protein
MSKFHNIVPVPLGEIRCLDGKLDTAAKPGILVTALSAFGGGSSTHPQPDYPNAVFTLNTELNTSGVLILINQEDLVTTAITEDIPSNSHARAHVLKAGEECTVILTTGDVIAAGDMLYPTADGKVEKGDGSQTPLFTAIETAAADSADDDLRILARVL